MAEYFYTARPVRDAGLKYADLVDDQTNEWHKKARALQVRRWYALQQASKPFFKRKFRKKR